MSSYDASVPDLLRRFVPTPYESHASLRNARLELRTNDAEVVAEMQRASVENASTDFSSRLSVKVIRDYEAPVDSSEIMVLSSGPVATLVVGTGTVLAVDRETQEILGFLAPSVSAKQFVDELLPILLNLFHGGGPCPRPAGSVTAP